MPKNAYGQTIGAPVAGWTQRSSPPRTPVEGRFCRLEPLDAGRHADDLFDAFAAAPDGRDWTYLPVERFEDREAYRAFLGAQAVSEDPLHHAILDAATRRAIGTAALMRIDPANGVVEIGHIVFAPQLKGTPAGTEAMFLLMRRVFDELGYRRLEWKCDSLNAPSCRAAERYGFVFEGVFRQAIVTKGRNRDTAWYAITDLDWPPLRKALTQWLRPDNFDPHLRQVRSLASLRGT